MLGRAPWALGFVVIGFNVLYLLCEGTEAENPRSPAWAFLSGFYSLEKTVLTVLFGVGFLVFVVFTLAEIKRSIRQADLRAEAEEEDRRWREARAQLQFEEEERERKLKIAHQEANRIVREMNQNRQDRLAGEASPVAYEPGPAQSLEQPKPKHSPRSLKEKAIEDILKGGF